MRKVNALQIYAAAVCFVTAIIGTVSGGSGIYDVVQMAAPQIGISGASYEGHRDNRAFALWYARRHGGGGQIRHVPPEVREEIEGRGFGDYLPPAAGRFAPLPENEEELTRVREQSFMSLLAAKQHNAVRDFVREIIVLLIAILLFFVHWRLLRKMHREQD